MISRDARSYSYSRRSASHILPFQESILWEPEMVAANRVAVINPPIDDTDPIRKVCIDPRSHTDLQNSGKKKEPKPKLFVPDIFRWGGGLPRERVGAKKFGMSLETQGNQTLGRDIPGFCRDIPPKVPEKFERKKVCVQFSSPMHDQHSWEYLFTCIPLSSRND